MKKSLHIGFLLAFLVACSDEIHDKVTKETVIEIDQLRADTKLIHPMSDAMDRGHHELEKNVVVDTSFYKTNPIARGDIVYFGDHELSRVIALPNEKLKINNGQIYINGALLVAFYGSAHVRGYDYQAFKSSDMEEPAKQNLINEIFKKNEGEITLNSDEFFVIGDDWSRSNSSTFRRLAKQDILGKVIGICTTKCNGS